MCLCLFVCVHVWVCDCVCVCMCLCVCPVECSGGVFHQRSGGFSSVDHPLPYPKSSDCSYSIQVEEGLVVELLFHPTFDVEDHPDLPCPYDYVQVTHLKHTRHYTRILYTHTHTLTYTLYTKHSQPPPTTDTHTLQTHKQYAIRTLYIPTLSHKYYVRDNV